MQQRDDASRTSAGWRRSSPTTTGDQWLPSVDGPVVFASGWRSVTDWYPVTESLCASASVRSRARGRRCAPGYVAGMVLEPEPVLVTDPTLTEVLDALRAREPLIDPLTVSVASWTRLWTSPWATTTG